jgi:Endonuclease I/Secretion system C-terminal sorting domain
LFLKIIQMKKNILVFLVFITSISFSQVVINELDSDSNSNDLLEFVELKSTTPNFSLNGYVLVFFNGSSSGLTSISYFAIDLDGFSTDVNGIIHIGNAQVTPVPDLIFQPATLQNGPDAIGLYLGDESDFPLNTVASTTGLIQALTYTNSTTVLPTALMSAFGLTTSPNENIGGTGASKSIQRKNDGTYEIKLPTPGVNNDGSGIAFNYLTTTANNILVTEGQSLNLTFSTTQPVSVAPLQINFTLSNGSFTNSDYSGSLSASIPVGSSSISATIQILNDNFNDGDEEIKVVLNTLPVPYAINNNNQIIRVKNINFVVLPFGSPSNATFGNIANLAPSGYYASLNGLSGNVLKQAVQEIIANPNEVRVHTYGDVNDIIQTADQNPENSNEVFLIYTEESRSKLDIQSTSSIVGKWNREHIYPQSRGNYAAGLDYDLFPDGINEWLLSSASDIGAGLTDAHHIRAVDGQENSSRNNKDFGLGDYNGPSGSTVNSWKGDVARSLFYMAVRYNGLSLVNGNPADATIGQLGDLATLLQWNQLDPADDFEMNRNNYIYTWQKNRNPFIDYPNLANYIWGANVGQVWSTNLASNDFSLQSVNFFPNPAKDYFIISGLNETSKLEIYNVIGEKVLEQTIENDSKIEINWSSGIYFVKITSDGKSIIKKISIN